VPQCPIADDANGSAAAYAGNVALPAFTRITPSRAAIIMIIIITISMTMFLVLSS